MAIGRSNQSGDTLIEVVLAITILGSILFSAYLLSSRAFSLGQSAKERSQAAQLIQQQAEGLRGLRDSLGWTAFRSKIANPSVMSNPLPAGSCSLAPSGAGNFSGRFHLEQEAGRWKPEANEVNTGDATFDPSGKYADFYTIWIDGCFLGDSDGDSNPDRLEAVVKIQWPRIGSLTACDSLPVEPECEVSELHINLTDRTLPTS